VAEPLEQFIIAGDPSIMKPMLDIFNADPESAVLAVSRNSQTDPERLVVSMDPDRAAALQAAFGALVLIEPDNPLDL
jgi:hypothetical protein